MSLQGSIHTWSDGIGYGAFIPTDQAYFNLRTPKAGARRPSGEQLREYRRNNVTAGIDTHRSDISFGKTTESIHGGTDGDSRAREAIKSLTSGEVGDFRWSTERVHRGKAETVPASSTASAPNTSVVASVSVSGRREGSNNSPQQDVLSARSAKNQERAAATKILSTRDQRQHASLIQGEHEQNGLVGQAGDKLSARSSTSTNSKSTGSSTQRSDVTYTSGGSYTSRQSSSRSSASSPGERQIVRGGNGSRGNTAYRTRQMASHGDAKLGTNPSAILPPHAQPLSQRSSSRSRGRENRLRPSKILGQEDPSPTLQTPRFRKLDPSFGKHHKYDLVAEERAVHGGEVTGRFGPVRGSSVLAASLLTSELSTPWSHVLRGQKW